ncbi:hypothetical protein LTR66_007218 [Elasticomyces elasticus]|nr:hypothetical protein LTR66_007218 [Elasticomyces elasticus]KAK5010813.1 hypothetical protein LTR28_007596 [Elasticomyces elasticus]
MVLDKTFQGLSDFCKSFQAQFDELKLGQKIALKEREELKAALRDARSDREELKATLERVKKALDDSSKFAANAQGSIDAFSDILAMNLQKIGSAISAPAVIAHNNDDEAASPYHPSSLQSKPSNKTSAEPHVGQMHEPSLTSFNKVRFVTGESAKQTPSQAQTTLPTLRGQMTGDHSYPAPKGVAAGKPKPRIYRPSDKDYTSKSSRDSDDSSESPPPVRFYGAKMPPFPPLHPITGSALDRREGENGGFPAESARLRTEVPPHVAANPPLPASQGHTDENANKRTIGDIVYSPTVKKRARSSVATEFKKPVIPKEKHKDLPADQILQTDIKEESPQTVRTAMKPLLGHASKSNQAETAAVVAKIAVGDDTRLPGLVHTANPLTATKRTPTGTDALIQPEEHTVTKPNLQKPQKKTATKVKPQEQHTEATASNKAVQPATEAQTTTPLNRARGFSDSPDDDDAASLLAMFAPRTEPLSRNSGRTIKSTMHPDMVPWKGVPESSLR